MKNNGLLYALATLAFLAGIYFIPRLFSDPNPSLNDDAMSPDVYLQNVKKYSNEKEPDRSLFHLDKAIETIRILEADVDITSGELLEKTVRDLRMIRIELETDLVDKEDMNSAISKALNTLSLVELRVSESYAETNKLEKAKVALNYGLLHLKNAIPFTKGPLHDKEVAIYQELDSLIRDETLYSIDLTLKIDKLIKELEVLLGEQRK